MTMFSARLRTLTVLPQSHDGSYYVSKRILAPTPLSLQQRSDLGAQDFAHSTDLWHQPRLANATCTWSFAELILLYYNTSRETVFQWIKKFSAFYKTLTFINVSTKALQWTPSPARRSTPHFHALFTYGPTSHNFSYSCLISQCMLHVTLTSPTI
jgi:hypothetical protein